ncbi:uncharacterized protein LOC128678080 [Plodia interpunctella]|uniref:uncharacterized protein LOC128678080 n=1 Tax=Plodia interpunctella TaxID=58824 RepID=UPI0023688385|nr:uncharacterized protein LOC128678080 [Plodia interpunctella]
MKLVLVALFICKTSLCQEVKVLTPSRRYKHNIAQVAKYQDAQHRGERWYSYSSMSHDPFEASHHSSDSLPSMTEREASESRSSDASSAYTSEINNKLKKKKLRKCTSCPYDMLKQFGNRGIKWICGQYQRARRSFKSECMMRYRNCEDGTMFVKMHDNRCKTDPYHGEHWFYIYKV